MLVQSLPSSVCTPRAVTRVTILSLVALLLAISLLLAARRIAGAVTFSLPWDATVVLAIAASLCVTAARTIWRRAFPRGRQESIRLDHFVGWGSTAALVLMAIGCSFPAERFGDWLVWLPALAVDQVLLHSFLAGSQAPRISAEPDQTREHGRYGPVQPVGDEVVQQLYRFRDSQGQDLVRGKLRADFEVGQRTAVLHVGFCPPLAYLPRIEATAGLDGNAIVKVVQALAHGARIDVRLQEIPTADRQIWIDIAAAPDTQDA